MLLITLLIYKPRLIRPDINSVTKPLLSFPILFLAINSFASFSAFFLAFSKLYCIIICSSFMSRSYTSTSSLPLTTNANHLAIPIPE